jgi:SAM-dependent methyltransferase
LALTAARPARSLPPAYFERLYAADPDPWSFATSDYERSKYTATLDALPQPRYRRALEVGCAIGVLTARLASRCDELLALDVVQSALDQAALRCRGLEGVGFGRMRFPAQEPPGAFDLVLLSEVAYYWSPADLDRAAAFIERALLPGGDLLLVHWIGGTDYPLSGDDATERLLAACHPFLRLLKAERTASYRLDLHRRVPLPD